MSPPGRIPPLLRGVTGARLDPDDTAIARVRGLDFDPRDVRHLVVTHLDHVELERSRELAHAALPG